MTVGVGALLGLIVRRDRIKLPLIIGSFVLLLLSMIPLLRDMYATDEALLSIYSALGTNPAILFLTGPMDGPTFSAFMTVETLLWWGLAIAFINTLLIVRHTRHNEEIGAAELILSGQAHRASGLVAALIAALAVNGLIVFGLGLGMSAMEPGWPAEQSWLYAAAMGGFGLVWASVAAVVVQLVESGRTANGVLAGLIGLSFLLRGIGDFLGKVDETGLLQPAWVSSLSPFGWMQATRPLTDPSWQPLLIIFGFAVAAAGLGFVLLARRDIGAGMLPNRRGRARATGWLLSPLGLTLHLQKNIFIGWLAGVLALVGTIGVMTPQIGELFGDSGADSVRRQFIEGIGGAGEMVPAFMSAMISITCLMVFAYVIHGLGRLRSEEASGHLENLMALGLSRTKWLGLHLLLVLAGGFVMLAMVGLGLALLVNVLSQYQVDTGQYLLAAISYAPVMMFFAALYLLLFGILPRLAGLVSWLYFGFVAFISWLGPILQLPDWVMKLSILEHLSTPPVESVELRPIAVVTALALIFIAIGLLTWRQRNLLEK